MVLVARFLQAGGLEVNPYEGIVKWSLDYLAAAP